MTSKLQPPLLALYCRSFVKPRTIVHKAKDSGFKAQDKAKDLCHKAKAKDLEFVLKDRSRPRTNNTGDVISIISVS